MLLVSAPTHTAAPDRLAALADGVFAIAITLLTLDIAALVDEHDDTAAILEALPPRLGSYLLRALILGLRSTNWGAGAPARR